MIQAQRFDVDYKT